MHFGNSLIFTHSFIHSFMRKSLTDFITGETTVYLYNTQLNTVLTYLYKIYSGIPTVHLY